MSFGSLHRNLFGEEDDEPLVLGLTRLNSTPNQTFSSVSDSKIPSYEQEIPPTSVPISSSSSSIPNNNNNTPSPTNNNVVATTSGEDPKFPSGANLSSRLVSTPVMLQRSYSDDFTQLINDPSFTESLSKWNITNNNNNNNKPSNKNIVGFTRGFPKKQGKNIGTDWKAFIELDKKKLDTIKSVDGSLEVKEIEDKLISFARKETNGTENYIKEKVIIRQLKEFGFSTKDPSTIKSLSTMKISSQGCPPGCISIDQLKNLPPSSSIIKALCENVEMKNWKSFTDDVVKFFEEVEPNTEGNTASYIPVLQEADPDQFAISICSVDGQQFSHGNSDAIFSIQSCVKPIIYALACQEIGVQEVHKWVGTEASGLSFNEISLNSVDRPHNPMINSGAIQCAGLLKRHLRAAPRFRYLLQEAEALAGGQKIGFSQDTYLGEFETAWRNNAIIHFMKAANAFPPHSKSEDILDMYLQGCSLEVDTQIMAVIAASLANRGVCPLTQKKCLSPWVVKSTLSLLFSCGMYDYSGEWSVEVGLPAKSGVAGLIFVVVPNLMGIAVFSPRLDVRGNSVRGIEICKKIMNKYQFGPFDQLLKRSTGISIISEKKQKRRAKYLLYLFAEKIQIYIKAYQNICGRDGTTIIQDLEFMLKSCGINPKSERVCRLLDQITQNGTKKRIQFRDLFVGQRYDDNLVFKCLRGCCCLPSVEEFSNDIKSIYLTVESHKEGNVAQSLQELRRVDEDLFGVAICSVDGQCFDFGDSSIDFPILGCVQPFIYALACQDIGLSEVHKWIGREPTSVNPSGFAYGRDGKPYNPFVDSGALAVASLLKPKINSTKRYKWVSRQLSNFSGGSRLTFSQPIFLEQKSSSHMLKAISHSMKGSKLYPSIDRTTDPTNVYLECSSIEVNCKKLAVMAATLANGGRCPITDKKMSSPEVTKSLYSLLYSCGMKHFSGWWNFHVGIPATYGESGCMLVVIPNVMGIALYSPRLNSCGISSRGIRFCELLTQKFRFGIFDQLVYGEREFSSPEIDNKGTDDDMLFFNLSNECAAGHYKDVEALLMKHPNIVNLCDYDKRTPLHVACSEGHEQIVKLLLQYGAIADVRDRWNNTPLDDLKSRKNNNLIPIIEDALKSQKVKLNNQQSTKKK